jgi:predicted RNA binding protein YcfA (HicA-like mRNA interferase family)
MAEWEKKVKRDLLDNGFTFKRSGKGSHEIWENDKGISVTICATINKILANSILKRAGINKRY